MLQYCNEMHADGTVADAQTYRAVLLSLEKSGKFEKVVSIAEEFMSMDLSVDLSSSCESILGSYAKLNRREAALKFWQHMKTNAWEPSEACYSTMMILHVNADLPQQAYTFLEEVDKLPITRTSTTNLSAIVVYAALGMTDEALKIFKKLLSDGIEANLYVIDMVLMAIEKDRRGDAIIDVVRAMRLGKIEPDARGYSMIISTYSRCGQIEEALMVLRRMLNDPRSVEVEPACVELVISSLIENSNA